MSIITDPSGSLYSPKTDNSGPPAGKFYAADANQLRIALLDIVDQLVSGTAFTGSGNAFRLNMTAPNFHLTDVFSDGVNIYGNSSLGTKLSIHHDPLGSTTPTAEGIESRIRFYGIDPSGTIRTYGAIESHINSNIDYDGIHSHMSFHVASGSADALSGARFRVTPKGSEWADEFGAVQIYLSATGDTPGLYSPNAQFTIGNQGSINFRRLSAFGAGESNVGDFYSSAEGDTTPGEPGNASALYVYTHDETGLETDMGRFGYVALDVTGASFTSTPFSSYKLSGTEYLTSCGIVPYDIGIYYAGQPPVSGVIMRYRAIRNFTLYNGFSGSAMDSAVSATSGQIIEFHLNGVTIATATFGAASSSAYFTRTGSLTIVPGDLLHVVCSGAQDSTLSDISLTLAGWYAGMTL
jgi:hypothetical protein